MVANRSDVIAALADRLSELYVGLEDAAEEGSVENLLKALELLQELRVSMEAFERLAVTVLRRHDVASPGIAARIGSTCEEILQRFPSADVEYSIVEQDSATLLAKRDSATYSALTIGNVYTRNDLRELFGIGDATLNTGVFYLKERHEIWLFVTENKPADREQYLDKLTGDTLYWQGQLMGRTDSLIVNHMRSGNNLLLFYRTAKYEFPGAGFRYEGTFEYVRHSGNHPTDFVLRRAVRQGSARALQR
jgi:hypothetical protein